ncbi:hypothetical protein IT409_00870 [Candidatus Falkowbacteria bacterium]|nr:hypothetical protein [Candidatus Falkowbacteria bacterium]
MTTPVLFRMNEKLKNKVMKKAKQDGLSLSAIINKTMEAYAAGEIVLHMTTKHELKESVKKELLEAFEDMKHGRNMSEAFDNAEDAIRYLKGL